ncbi:MAG: coenzyme F420-0:L-glutamate ligase [Patescibacteria group bacterium]|nr:coenzyme F420-0:L-glutamate ligase [Patescibacteria group bacterium]
MKVTAYKTKKIVPGDNLYKILDQYLAKEISDKSVVAVTSKIIAICESRVEKIKSEEQKDILAKKEAEAYLPREYNQYGFMITINRGILVASAGIDASNGNGYYVLWPKNPQESANKIRNYLLKKYRLKNLGVIITDSKLSPLRWGVTGVAIAYSGFKALKSYIDTPDIFGRLMRAEKSNIADSLAAAAVIEMGEGNEQKPLAIIKDAGFINFQKQNPTKKELDSLKISIGDDVFSSLLESVKWQSNKK